MHGHEQHYRLRPEHGYKDGKRQRREAESAGNDGRLVDIRVLKEIILR